MMSRLLLALALVIADRRIVDRVRLGDAASERAHACARGADWTRCSLTTFDDTEVTISASLEGAAVSPTLELIVENRSVTSYTVSPGDSATVEFRVPREITAGRTNIIVMLRGNVPALLSLRSIQDHNE